MEKGIPSAIARHAAPLERGAGNLGPETFRYLWHDGILEREIKKGLPPKKGGRPFAILRMGGVYREETVQRFADRCAYQEADNGFHQALESHEEDNKVEGVGCTQGSDNALDVFGMIKAHH